MRSSELVDSGSNQTNTTVFQLSFPPGSKKKCFIFTSVKLACVDLVKKHGHPISLIDEEAFQSLIQLMPMTTKQKARITSEYIKKYLDATVAEDVVSLV